ncbi:MAG: S8 family serine peptidase, partial [Chloroflexota bacterium]
MISVDALQDASFSWQAAMTLANGSKLVYQRGSSIHTVVVNSWGFDACEFISERDTQLFIATQKDKTIIAFRGTQGIRDWIRNMDLIWTDEQPYGQVHSGFYTAYHDAHPAILAVLAKLPDTQKLWVTGHSLGGALASLCVAELAATHKDQIVACYTYGQPRTGNSDFQTFIHNNYGDRYYRFVNDDDIVTRIPPLFKHVGNLIHFGFDGSLLTPPPGSEETFDDFFDDPTVESEAGFEEAATEIEPVSEAEFEMLKQNLAYGYGEEAFEGDEVDITAEGLLPSVSDHAMNEYVRKIMPHERTSSTRETTPAAPVDWQVEDMVNFAYDMENAESLDLSESETAPILIPVLIKAVGSWVPSDELIINSQIGNIFTAQLTAEQLDTLRGNPQIHSIQRSPTSYVEDEIITALPFVKADRVHKPAETEGEKGELAIVGIIDTGIDVLHEAFTAAADPTKTRILYIWDQRVRNPGSKTPSEVNSAFSARYGRLYTAADIETFMASKAAGTPLSMRNARGRSGSGGHGTHVAGIAAGRAVGDIGDGVAPEAKIAFVIPKLETEEGDPTSLGYSVTHLDGLVFLKEVREQENLPMVINVSLGMNAGSHDGTSTLEAGFDAITGLGRDPGLVIVKSAGNERGHDGHAKINATTNLIEMVSWSSKAVNRPKDYIEGWYDDFDDLEFCLIAPNGERSTSISFDPATDMPTEPKIVSGLLGGNQYELRLTETHPDNGNSLIQIMVRRGVSPIKPILGGEWQLEVTGKQVVSHTGRVDFWIERDSRRSIKFIEGADDSMTLSVPGTANTV